MKTTLDTINNLEVESTYSLKKATSVGRHTPLTIAPSQTSPSTVYLSYRFLMGFKNKIGLRVMCRGNQLPFNCPQCIHMTFLGIILESLSFDTFSLVISVIVTNEYK